MVAGIVPYSDRKLHIATIDLLIHTRIADTCPYQLYTKRSTSGVKKLFREPGNPSVGKRSKHSLCTARLPTKLRVLRFATTVFVKIAIVIIVYFTVIVTMTLSRDFVFHKSAKPFTTTDFGVIFGGNDFNRRWCAVSWVCLVQQNYFSMNVWTSIAFCSQN